MLVLAAVFIPKTRSGFHIALWIALVATLGAMGAAPARFARGLIVGAILSAGLDAAYWNWVGIESNLTWFAWSFLFWPDRIFTTVAIEDWGWRDGHPLRVLGYGVSGLSYGTIIAIVHACKGAGLQKAPEPKTEVGTSAQ